MRQDAPFTRRRSRLESILNVAHSVNKLSWQLGVGEKNYASGAFIDCGLPAERRVLARRGWVGEMSELFEHTAGPFFTESARWASCASGEFVLAWNAGAYPTEDFIGDCADPAGNFISPNRFLPLLTDQGGGLTHLYRCEICHIHHDHIHAH